MKSFAISPFCEIWSDKISLQSLQVWSASQNVCDIVPDKQVLNKIVSTNIHNAGTPIDKNTRCVIHLIVCHWNEYWADCNMLSAKLTKLIILNQIFDEF